MTEQPTPAPHDPSTDTTTPAARRPRFGTRARWVAGLGGVAVAAAIAVPAVASAATPAAAQTGSTPAASCTVLDRVTAQATSAPELRDYLAAHPDVNTELTKVRAMPKDQRRAELKTYLTANPDVKAALKNARSAETTLRHGCK